MFPLNLTKCVLSKCFNLAKNVSVLVSVSLFDPKASGRLATASEILYSPTLGSSADRELTRLEKLLHFCDHGLGRVERILHQPMHLENLRLLASENT